MSSHLMADTAARHILPMPSVSNMRYSSIPFGAVSQRAHPCQLRHPWQLFKRGAAQQVGMQHVVCMLLTVRTSGACSFYCKSVFDVDAVRCSAGQQLWEHRTAAHQRSLHCHPGGRFL